LTRYVDSSAVVKLYVQEPDSEHAASLLAEPWAAGRHTLVEVRRALVQALEGDELMLARHRFSKDWTATSVIELDEASCERAAELAESTGARALDALHLAAAEKAGGGELPIVTFDRRLAEAARSLGWEVLGA
jgi:uncharacterized protein